MNLPTTSVIVVSWQRPDALVLCLQSLVRQRLAPAYEIIVVADSAGLAAVASLPDAAQMKLVACDRPNISAARNLGVAVAAGQVVAFIDDDAQAEPRWLSHLVAPFAAEDVACTGGYVRGRNGISFQWTSRSLDSTGTAHPATLGGLAPGHPALPPGHALKTEGTNMAVRRDILCSLGGFDEAYRYYLDETDLNWRLHLSGYKTLLVPLAQVVHGFAPAAHRGPERRIRSLVEIGASQAVFLRRHHPSHGHEACLADGSTAPKAQGVGANGRWAALRLGCGGGVARLSRGRGPRHGAPPAPLGPTIRPTPTALSSLSQPCQWPRYLAGRAAVATRGAYTARGVFGPIGRNRMRVLFWAQHVVSPYALSPGRVLAANRRPVGAQPARWRFGAILALCPTFCGGTAAYRGT